MSTFLELKAAFDAARESGTTLPVVRFKQRIEDLEGYFDVGMMARVQSIVLNDSYPVYEGGDLYKVTFSFAEFDEYNSTLEQANYYDSNGQPRLTATESGNKPSSGREDVYFMEFEDKYGPYFDIEGESTAAVKFPDHESLDVAVAALNLHKATLEMRVQEAMNSKIGNPDNDLNQAASELNSVIRALNALGVKVDS